MTDPMRNGDDVARPKANVLPRPDEILTLAQASLYTSLSRSSIYRLLQAGEFPPLIRLSPHRVGISKRELELWIEKRKCPHPISHVKGSAR